MQTRIPTAEELKATATAGAHDNPALANIPPENRAMFQRFLNAKKPSVATMNIKGKARPEELAALRGAGIAEDAELPYNVADLLAQAKTEQDLIAEMEDTPSLSVNDIKEIPFNEAPPDIQRTFADMVKKSNEMKAKSTVIFDSRKKQPATPTTPAAPPVVSLPQLAEMTKASVAPVVPPAPIAEETPVPPPSNTPAICPRCHLDQRVDYPVKPTPEDIENRLFSIASSIQGGDGRFRKVYSVFQGKVKLHFKELKNEGYLIYQTEKEIAFSDPTNKTNIEQYFSIDRANFRRHCCGLEKVEVQGRVIPVPSLDEAIELNKGDIVQALELLEQFVRTELYSSESMMMAAGRCWLAFEDLITALWQDQSFYNGTP